MLLDYINTLLNEFAAEVIFENRRLFDDDPIRLQLELILEVIREVGDTFHYEFVVGVLLVLQIKL